MHLRRWWLRSRSTPLACHVGRVGGGAWRRQTHPFFETVSWLLDHAHWPRSLWCSIPIPPQKGLNNKRSRVLMMLPCCLFSFFTSSVHIWTIWIIITRIHVYYHLFRPPSGKTRPPVHAIWFAYVPAPRSICNKRALIAMQNSNARRIIIRRCNSLLLVAWHSFRFCLRRFCHCLRRRACAV